MLHLIAYDIRDSKRLHKVAKTCEDYGFRIEYSVFECDLDEKTFQDLWNRLNKVIDPDADCIIAYKICKSCVSKIKSIGASKRNGKVLLYIL